MIETQALMTRHLADLPRNDILRAETQSIETDSCPVVEVRGAG